MTYSSLNQQSALGSGGSAGIQRGLGASLTPKKPKQVVFFDREGHQPGYRIPVIDKKINELTLKAKRIHHKHGDFVHAYAETVIETLGDYNPLYSKRPKKLTLALLSRVEMGKCWNNTALIYSGLMYMIPGLPGVRSQRCRISVAGWELMEHWAKKFPAFKKHWLAYVDKKAKAQIYSDCFDLALGHRPASFVEMDKIAPAYQVKLEARLYREMMKKNKAMEEAAKRQAGSSLFAQQMNQQMAMQHYQDAVNGRLGQQYQQVQALGLYDPNLSPVATSSGGYVHTTMATGGTSIVTPKGIIKSLLGMS